MIVLFVVQKNMQVSSLAARTSLKFYLHCTYLFFVSLFYGILGTLNSDVENIINGNGKSENRCLIAS